MWNLLKRISLLLLFSFQFLSSLNAQHFDNGREWSGWMTYVSTEKGSWSGKDGTGGSHFSELRMEASISNGRGRAHSTDITQKSNTVKVNDGSLYTETVDGSATGDDTTTVLITISDVNTYEIEFRAPNPKGTITTKGSHSITRVYSWADPPEAPLSMIVSDQKLGKNPKVLAGEEITNSSNKDGEYVIIIRWCLTRGPIDEELIVKPIEYNTWLPIPGGDEKTPGSEITISLQLKGKNGKPLSFDAKYFDIDLKNTSREMGTTINYPAKNFSSVGLPDLGFLPTYGATVAADGQSVKLLCDDGKSGLIQVASYDGGGYTTLSVEAVLEGGIRVKGHLEKPEGPTDILLPKRKEGSHIATSWLNDNGNPGEDDDKDSSPSNENAGDGLTAYEEYRGVWSEGKFKRLSPKKKELGVGIEKKNMEEFASGIALLKVAAGIDVIVLNEDELDIKRVFNINSLAGGHKQYALKLYNGDAHGNEGVNIPAARHNKTPKLSDSVIVDIQYIRSGYISQDSAAMKGNKKLPYTAEDDIASTVAHELAHGIHVAHHGPPSDEPSGYESYIGAPVVCKIYDADGNLIMDRPFKIRGRVGSVGCDESGDLNCIMVYTSFYQWAYRKGEDGSLIYRVVPYLPQPKHLCTSAKGTGINANGYFGKATEGNCVAQIKVRDE